MEEKLFVKCISSIINSNKPGYGFVSDFADCLLNISQEETLEVASMRHFPIDVLKLAAEVSTYK